MDPGHGDPRRVTVVMPTYCEVENLELIAKAVTVHGYRLLVVDDASPDGTGELADRLAAESDSIDVVHRSAKQGLGPAYAEGFAVALARGAAIVCEMDADFSHDPDQLPALIAAVDAGADLAIGSRFVAGGRIVDWPLRRRLLSRLGNLYARIMLSLGVRDATSGFRAYRSTLLERLEAATCAAQGYTFQVEMAWRAGRAGALVVEVPITFREREVGESKLDAGIVREAIGLVTRWGLGRLFGRRGWRPRG